jgi:hypothetical protein
MLFPFPWVEQEYLLEEIYGLADLGKDGGVTQYENILLVCSARVELLVVYLPIVWISFTRID